MLKQSLILIIVFAMIGAACGFGLQGKLVGKWGNKYGSNGWDIKSNGTIDVVEKGDGVATKTVATGTFKVIDGESFEITWEDTPSKPDRIKVKFNDSGGMVLTLPDGSQRVFVKAE